MSLKKKKMIYQKLCQLKYKICKKKIAELRAKLIEKINSENDYDKMEKIYELISNL